MKIKLPIKIIEDDRGGEMKPWLRDKLFQRGLGIIWLTAVQIGFFV